MKKKIIIGSVAAVALIVAVAIAAPFYNVHRFFQAVENRDAGGISEAVDMAEVRTQFQSQFQAELVHNPDQSFQQWAAFRKREAEATFELMVTPDGLLRMMPVAFAQRDRQWAFLSPSRVAVTVEAASAESLATKLTFQRQGLLTWRLTRVERIRRDGSPDFSLAPGEEAGNTTVLSLDDMTPDELAEFHAVPTEDEVDALERVADHYDELADMTSGEVTTDLMDDGLQTYFPEFSARNGEEYGQVRARLLKLGFSPARYVPRAGAESTDIQFTSNEFSSCSGTGAAYCKGYWAKGNRVIEVFTSDGPDGIFESAAVVDARAAQEDLAASGLVAVGPAAHAISGGR